MHPGKNNPLLHKDHRRHTPSFSIPIIYWVFELVGGWFVASLFSFSFYLGNWHLFSKAIFLIWTIYTLYRFVKIFLRQFKQKKSARFRKDVYHPWD